MLQKHLFNEAQGRVGLILVLRFREVTSEVASPDMLARGQHSADQLPKRVSSLRNVPGQMEALFSALQVGREEEAPV